MLRARDADNEDANHIMASAKALLQLAPPELRSDVNLVSQELANEKDPQANGDLPPDPHPEALPDLKPELSSEVKPELKPEIKFDPLVPLESGAHRRNSTASVLENGTRGNLPKEKTEVDPARLLALAASLESMYDPEDLRYPVSEFFLVGYTVLANEPHQVCRDIQNDLAEYLLSHGATTSPHSDFKVGLVYTVLAIGTLTVPGREYRSEDVATAFINKAWNILVERLIPKHTSLVFQSAILRNLYVLTYTYLRFFNNDLMVLYLEDSAHIILQNLLQAPPAVADEILAANSCLLWSIYVLVSRHRPGDGPPKFFLWFLALRLPEPTNNGNGNGSVINGNGFLAGVRRRSHDGLDLPKLHAHFRPQGSVYGQQPPFHNHNYNSTATGPAAVAVAAAAAPLTSTDKSLRAFMHHGVPTDRMSADIYSCTLANDLANVHVNGAMWVYELRAQLHASIWRAITMGFWLESLGLNLGPAFGSIGSRACSGAVAPVLLASTFFDIFAVLHTKLLQSPFRDLLEGVRPVTDAHHWSVLATALREHNSGFCFDRFVRENVHSLFQTFGTALLDFLARPAALDFDTSYTVGSVSYALVLQHTLLKMHHVAMPINPATLPLVDVAHHINVVLEWYITVVKLLVESLRSAPSRVLQCIIHVLGQESSSSSSLLSSPESHMAVLNDLLRVCDTWLAYLGHNAHLAAFRLHMTRFLNDVVVLALNNDSFAIADLYVTNESVLLRNRRSQSISAIDTNVGQVSRGSILTAPPVFSQAPLPAVPTNYVLKNESMSPTTLLPPLNPAPVNISASNLTALTTLTESNGPTPTVAVAKFPFPVLPMSGSLVLPPIHPPRDEKSFGLNRMVD